MKVTKFKLNNKIFTLNEEDGKYYSEDGKWANYVEMLNDEVIEYSSKDTDLQQTYRKEE